MGNPMNGDVYEGLLRPGDVGLNEKEFEYFKTVPVRDRLTEFQQRFREQGQALAASDSGVTSEMPRYKCHKEVWALKIAAIERVKPTVEELQRIPEGEQENPNFNAAIITPADEGYAPFGVDDTYLRKHDPQAGGYFVVYKDGYKSYSPAQAFEEGYTRL